MMIYMRSQQSSKTEEGLPWWSACSSVRWSRTSRAYSSHLVVVQGDRCVWMRLKAWKGSATNGRFIRGCRVIRNHVVSITERRVIERVVTSKEDGLHLWCIEALEEDWSVVVGSAHVDFLSIDQSVKSIFMSKHKNTFHVLFRFLWPMAIGNSTGTA